ncbi:type ISP restriction/modification enzyme [Patescibacteria group bacterium]
MTDKSKEIVQDYIQEINEVLKSGDAREHAYRPAFQKLIENLKPDVQVINEPAYTGGNAPDFLFKKGDTPIAYAECKDVTVDISHKDVQKQAKRYVDAFGRILLTNYFDFEILNEEGELVSISIAEKIDRDINPIEKNFERFANLICDYITPSHRTIRSAKKLAKIMANKGQILRDNALASLTENPDSDIHKQYETFKEVLIHDLSESDFADMYAQTLVYGLFVARYFDSTLPTFSRHEAQDLLPKSNPLLKKFFGHVAGTDYDPKIAWLVDSLVDAYLSTNVYELMHKEFVKKQKDPVLHFYETFLAEYDKGLRKSRGVYYTPEPVVSFIVRSVDQLLKTKFNLPKGLADTSKIDHKFKIQAEDGRTKDGIKRTSDQIHKVQVLDPAAGTGTFLNDVILEIHKSFKGQEGMWPKYVENHLLPRLHGFELMMASYTMAHLKLGVTLKELGYEGDERLSVWLTNSLEESVHEVPNLFMSQWLTEESHKASHIKSELPIMVVLGNPPYSVSSSNKGESIQNLIKVYKENLNERKINLDDDYIKFIRFAENQIEKTGFGIVAMITNNSFIDGVTHRQMRKHLIETFDEIYVMDLHGNVKKKETAPDGGKDENVFNIMQGVSINLFVKTGEGKGLAKVYHSELFGKQKEKYEKLDEKSFETVKWEKVKAPEPYYFFVPKDFGGQKEYEEGFGVNEIFGIYSSGVETAKDATVIQFNRNKIKRVLSDFQEKENEELSNEYNLKSEKVTQVVDDLKRKNYQITKINYRPFDSRYTIYTDMSQGVLWRPRHKVMQHLVEKENIGFVAKRGMSELNSAMCFLSDAIIDRRFWSCPGMQGAEQLFPLYLYHEDGTKTPNLNDEVIRKIEDSLHLTFSLSILENSVKELGDLETPPRVQTKDTHFEPEDILDYIYAVLHSPGYREKYKEFLKIDFPRVPYPKDKKVFRKLVKLGRKLRELHLLESPKVNNFITTFPESGTNKVEKKYPKYENSKVYINETQYFGKAPEAAWNFYIGGYQPTQKWLKDRRDRELSVEDIEHYQQMIVALSETERIMEEIDEVI